MSARAARLAGWVTTMKRQPCKLEAVGACRAMFKHSSMTSRSTGRPKSRRLRTVRVVVSSSSGVSNNVRPVGEDAMADFLPNENLRCACGELYTTEGAQNGVLVR